MCLHAENRVYIENYGQIVSTDQALGQMAHRPTGQLIIAHIENLESAVRLMN